MRNYSIGNQVIFNKNKIYNDFSKSKRCWGNGSDKLNSS